VIGHFLVVQTNFLPSTDPLTVTAVDTRDSRRVFRVRPFGASESSWIVSKPALDAANDTIVTHDTNAGQMAALHLDPRRGLRVRWGRKLTSLDFSALVGPAERRQIVIPDLTARGDTVAVLADPSAPGNIVAGLPRPLLLPVGKRAAMGALDRAAKRGRRIFDTWLKTGPKAAPSVAA
jgi:hypothetical protein